ncbi:MAG TPA: hypothetical protein VF297_08500 [Pyrinomonadaceae bacterium]
MKGKAVFQLTWLALASAFLLAASLSTNAPAQSGRIVPTPTPTPTPTPEVERTTGVEEPKFVPDPNAEKYRLVFATRYQGSFSVRTYDELELVQRSAFDNFAEGLNRAGAQGYRVVTSLKGDPAVVALDKFQYEYAWTQSRSPVARRPSFAGAYALLAKRGFRLATHSRLYVHCDYYGGEVGTPYAEQCEYADFFLFERRKGFESSFERDSVDTASAGERRKGQSFEDVLTAAVNAKRAEGFYPAHLISKDEILLEREPTEQALADAGTELRVVRSSNVWRRDESPKKVNELARQGFRLALADREIAVMYRRAGATAPLTYIWLKSSRKDLEKELARLQEAGAVFRATYPNEEGNRRTLIFEQGAATTRREYRVLKFELQTRHNAAEQVMETTLAPASADVRRELNRLAAEGFVVLALFDTDNSKLTRPGKEREGLLSEEYGVLLERRR